MTYYENSVLTRSSWLWRKRPSSARKILPTVDTAKRPWPTWRVGRWWGSSRSSSARLGRSQKDSLPPAAANTAVQGHRLALGGSNDAAPFDKGRRRAALRKSCFYQAAGVWL